MSLPRTPLESKSSDSELELDLDLVELDVSEPSPLPSKEQIVELLKAPVFKAQSWVDVYAPAPPALEINPHYLEAISAPSKKKERRTLTDESRETMNQLLAGNQVVAANRVETQRRQTILFAFNPNATIAGAPSGPQPSVNLSASSSSSLPVSPTRSLLAPLSPDLLPAAPPPSPTANGGARGRRDRFLSANRQQHLDAQLGNTALRFVPVPPNKPQPR